MKQIIGLLILTIFFITGCNDSTTKAIENNQTEVLDENNSTENNNSNENNSTDGNNSNENNSTDDNNSNGNNSTDDNNSNGNNSTDDNNSNENNSTDGNNSNENNSTDDNSSNENNSTDGNNSNENNSTDDNNLNENDSTDGNNLNENDSTDNNSTLIGKVIDGEISGATLFLDLDKDSELDSNEPTTVTKADGTYVLVLTKEHREHENYLNKTAPLVVFGGKDIRTNEAFEDYLMAIRSDSNLTFITPFSTLIAQTLFDKLEETSSKRLQKTGTEQLSTLELKMAEIKKNLAELFGLNESILDKDPIALAKEGDNSLLSQSLQLHKSAKAMKRAMKKDVKNLRKSILKSYRSLGKELKKLKRSALKNKDEALLEALDTAMDDSELFDTNLVKEVKEETKEIVKNINEFWKGQEGTLTDNALSDAIKEGETQLHSDTTKPIITLLGESTVSLLQGTAYLDAGATALDDRDGDISSNIVVNNSVDSNTLGDYTITYHVKDSSNNRATEVTRTVSVVLAPDTTSPIITLNGSSSLTLTRGTVYNDAGATASDDRDGNLTSSIVVTNPVNSSIDGRYLIKYNVSDNAQNSAIEIIRTVDIIPPVIIPPPPPAQDTTPPVITLLGENNISIVQGTHYVDSGATALDDRDGNLLVSTVGDVNSSEVGVYTITYSASDSAGNHASLTRTVNILLDNYAYVPKVLDNATAIRFLNKATFGATKENIEALKSKGVVTWIDEQLALPLNDNQYLVKMIEMAKKMSPNDNLHTIEEYLADNEMMFNQNVASFYSGRYRMSAWFDIVLTSQDQLRQKMTYALSQIIVESDFEPIFTRRADALATYYDILHRNAFGNYKDLLNEISLNSGMGVFLTFNGSKKKYQNEANVTVYPDENYAREIMQLFSIGLMKLNMDGTPILDNGNPIPTYSQEDVNALARVFTGWDLKRNRRYGLVGFKRGDYTQPLEFTSSYHDDGEKLLLGDTIPSGLSGEDDIKKAIEILMSNSSTAPFISKHLIMRLTKSNPTPSYVQRVAMVFQNSGGDLKATLKAIFLDIELWDDIKQKRVVKFKEPLIAYTSFLKAFNAEAFPSWYFCGFGGAADDTASNCQVVENSFLFNDTRRFLNQGTGLAPTVFNFYDNSFIPNSTGFKSSKSVAPEIQIQSDTVFINLSNEIRSNLFNWEKNYLLNEYMPNYKNGGAAKRYDSIEAFIADAPIRGYVPVYYVGANKMLLDVSAELDVMEMVIDGNRDGDFSNLQNYQESDYTDDERAVDTLVEHLNQKLTGGLLTSQQVAIIADNLKNKIFNKYDVGNSDDGNIDESKYNKKRQLLKGVIFPAIRAVVTSNVYMTE